MAIDRSGYCYSHHPDHVDERRRAARHAAKRGGRGRPSTLLAALRAENGELRKRLLEGELAPGVVAVAIQSINADIRSLSVSLQAAEQEEMISRMEDLERSIEAGRQHRNGSGYAS